MTLLGRARAALQRARADGALRPLASEVEVVRDDGVDFVVRRIVAFQQKPRGTIEADPFLPPWTDALFVEDRGPDHALLLNKFPVLPDHLLLVTRRFEDQEACPDDADWDALRGCLVELDALWFYNGGRSSGASQPHRHLQLVATDSLGDVPLGERLRGGVGRGAVSGFDFAHAVLPGVDGPAIRAALAAFGNGPHTLLGTREWTLIVPRSAPAVDGQPVNSLAYAGLLAAKSAEGVAAVHRRGPFGVLRAAAR